MTRIGRAGRAAAVLVGLALAAPAAGQRSPDQEPVGAGSPADEPTTTAEVGPGWLFPDRDLFPDLLAGPRDPVVKGQLVYADPDPTRYGRGVSGEVAIAGTVPLVRIWGAGARALLLGMEGAAFAHFSFEVVTRELVNTDWVFAVPLVYRHGDHWVRLRYYHTSSHLGDEYQRRFGPSSINFARDGVDVVAYLRPGVGVLERLGVGAYGGGLLSINSHPEGEAVWRLRGGLEIDPGRGTRWTPFAAVDLEREEHSGHGWRVSGQVGLWLLPVNGRPLRAAIEGVRGPSAMGQFSGELTRRVALGLYWNP
jgi:hypothetical protein